MTYRKEDKIVKTTTRISLSHRALLTSPKLRRLHGVLAGGEVDVLLVLLLRLERPLVLLKVELVLHLNPRCNGRTLVNRLLIARVFFGRRSRGAYFFFLYSSRRFARAFWFMTVMTRAIDLRTVLLRESCKSRQQ